MIQRCCHFSWTWLWRQQTISGQIPWHCSSECLIQCCLLWIYCVELGQLQSNDLTKVMKSQNRQVSIVYILKWPKTRAWSFQKYKKKFQNGHATKTTLLQLPTNSTSTDVHVRENAAQCKLEFLWMITLSMIIASYRSNWDAQWKKKAIIKSELYQGSILQLTGRRCNQNLSTGEFSELVASWRLVFCR